MESVYIETTIVSYLVARPSRDLVIASRQHTTRLWWEHRRPWFACYISEVVVEEAGDGDAEMAARRLAALAGIERLPITAETEELAAAFLSTGALPFGANDDALHLAVATCARIDFLLTLDNRHLANAQIGRRLRLEAEARGWNLPAVCSPEQLIG